MNNEILELSIDIEMKVSSNQGSRCTCIENDKLLKLCKFIEYINSLEPVGYINPVAQVCIRRKLNAAIKPNKEYNSIPLYRLD
ncbi:MAG: hypothetical protein MEPRV_01105 [Providencia sp.]